MELRDIFLPRGLNLRDTDINRPPEFASDCRNVEKNNKGEIIQRGGFDKVTDVSTAEDELGNAETMTSTVEMFEYVGEKLTILTTEQFGIDNIIAMFF